MQVKDIQAHFHQPACSHSSEKEGCDKPKGGESCAFDGAYIVLNPISDAAHLIHGGTTCSSHNFETRGSLASKSQMYKNSFSTEVGELDIIYGAEEKLEKAIDHIIENYHPSAVFVYQTCIPALTGEDVEKVSKDSTEKHGVPIIPVVAPGFLGFKNLGNRIGGEVLLNHVIGTGTMAEDKKNLPSINIIGEYNISGDLWNVLPLFEKLGIYVNSKMTGDAVYEEVTRAHHSKLSLLVCSRALINLAFGLKQKYDIDYIEVSFFGKTNTSTALQGTADFFEASFPGISQKAKDFIASEEAKLEQELAEYLPRLKGKRAVLYSGGVKSWSMVSALMDLGIEITAVGAKKASKSDVEKIKNLVGDEKILPDTNAKILLESIKGGKADFLIAGSRNQYLAYKEGIPYLDVNQERHHAYGGYSGLLQLAKDLVTTLEAPAWKLAQEPSPFLPVRNEDSVMEKVGG